MDNPAPIDLDALAAFNPDLAAQALAQLYADGLREAALAGALAHPRLDLFATARLREEWVAPFKRGQSFAFGSAQRSLFSLVVESFDDEGLGRLASRSEQDAQAIFGARWSELADMAAHDVEQANPVGFLERVLPKLAPKAPNPDQKSFSRHLHGSGERLAKALVARRRFEWLDLTASLHLQANGEPLNMSDMLRPAVEEADEERVLALRQAGVVPAMNWEAHAPALAASQKPALESLALTIAREAFDERARKRQQDRMRWSSDRDGALTPLDPAQVHDNIDACLWSSKPRSTSLAWLGAHLDWGVDPFGPREHGVAPCAALLSNDWRHSVGYAARDDYALSLSARRDADDQALALLEAMIQARPDGAGERFEVGRLPSDFQKFFPKARKVDFLCLCVAQGFYRCADALVGAGVDWRFAAKQCSGLAPRKGDGPDALGVALAYFEGLAVRETSLKTCARQAAKAAKKGAALPEPSTPSKLRL